MYVYMCVCAPVYSCVYMCIRVCVQECVQVYICIYVSVCACACMYVYVCGNMFRGQRATSGAVSQGQLYFLRIILMYVYMCA